MLTMVKADIAGSLLLMDFPPHSLSVLTPVGLEWRREKKGNQKALTGLEFSKMCFGLAGSHKYFHGLFETLPHYWEFFYLKFLTTGKHVCRLA